MRLHAFLRSLKRQVFFSSLLYALVAFMSSEKQLNQQELEKFKSSCQFYASPFFL